MIADELAFHIRHAMGLEPTGEQQHAMGVFCQFAADPDAHAVMVMRGSAGTGKTTLASAIVRAWLALGQKVMLLAPTGRAAKVFALNSGHAAFTIHRKIYRQKAFTGDMSGFNLNDNLHRDTLFIIDEASMVSNQVGAEASFGSGRLLDDLVAFVYGGANCRLMLIGDKAQLPPVGEAESPALMPQFLEGYGLKTYCCDLNEVMRQSRQSGILYNATVVRSMVTHDRATALPLIRFRGFADILQVPGDELIESLHSSYGEVGMDEAIVVTRSNKRANIYNRGIRASVLGREEELCTGDMLIVVRNNYHWAAKEKQCPLEFIANGDRVRVRRVRNHQKLYGFRFADVWLEFPDYDNFELEATIMLDSLLSEAPALTREQGDALFQGVLADYADIPLKHDRMLKVRDDRYFNALQVKYAYAVTCHKAQGGQWEHVYVDQGYMTDDMLTPSYIHWLYTAFTRATSKLFLVNWPRTQTEEPVD
ncbi:MAG: AAA family ATPase [Prevotella sp.]|nr:AAA family ATPase [Prevotella sp.]MBQ4295466.1 AAA family ATPase [Prevotella sp.]